MDIRATLTTGDALLFCGNSPTGGILRGLSSSDWNHSGIAVRFNRTGEGVFEISLTEEGELYVLETNTGTRNDDIYGGKIVGAGFSRADWVFHKYNRVSVRRLHDSFRNETLAALTTKFADLHRGIKFPSSTLPFISVWLGIDLVNKDESVVEMFCSELMAHYYLYCIGPQFKDITGKDEEINLTNLFGSTAPKYERMYKPSDYTFGKIPDSPIFKNTEEVIFVEHGDLLYIILQPLIYVLVFLLILWYIIF